MNASRTATKGTGKEKREAKKKVPCSMCDITPCRKPSTRRPPSGVTWANKRQLHSQQSFKREKMDKSYMYLVTVLVLDVLPFCRDDLIGCGSQAVSAGHLLFLFLFCFCNGCTMVMCFLKSKIPFSCEHSPSGERTEVTADTPRGITPCTQGEREAVQPCPTLL